MAWIPSQASYNDCRFSEYTGLDPTLALISFVEYPFDNTNDSSTSPHQSDLPPIVGLPSKPQYVNPQKIDHSLASTSNEMRAVIREGVSALMADVQGAIDNIKDNDRYRSIRMPTQALFHLQQAYYWNILPGTVTKIGHTLVLAGLKRAVCELHGFLLWIKDRDMPVKTQMLPRFCGKPYSTRGVYVDNIKDYHAIGQYGVAVYMEVDLKHMSLPPTARKISASPIPNHRQLLMPLSYSGGHHAYIIFYPPTVEHHSLFELAGRGYVSRLDQYEPNRQVEKIVDLMVRDTSELACHFDVIDDVKCAPEIAQGLFFPSLTRKRIAHHFRQQVEEELVGIQPFSPIPALYIWRSARQEMKWPPAHTGPGRPPPIVTAVPPPLMFFRCANAEKQRSFFFIWICMRREWLYSFEHTAHEARSSFLLTHQDWRQILSGERFKKAAKRIGKPYDLRYFWRSDPFFCDAQTAADEKLDLAPLIEDDNRLQPDHFLDSNEHAFTLKRMVCYDIALTHIGHQFNQADEFYLRERNLGEHEMAKRRRDRSSLFRETVTMKFTPPPWQSDTLDVRAAWFEKLRLLLLDWPTVCDAHGTASVIGLQEPEFSNEVYRLLVVYYSGVAIALNTIPTSMWTHPSPCGLGLWSYHLI